MSLDLNFDNPGLRKENKIKKVSWENWEIDTNPYNDKFEPDEIAQVPGNTRSYYSTIHTIHTIHIQT